MSNLRDHIYGSPDEAETDFEKSTNMPNDSTIDMVTLFMQEGRSDKVYFLEIERRGVNLYDVNFAYGRRGAHLNTGKKVEYVPLARARQVFEKYRNEKMAKGYWIGENRGRWRPPTGAEFAQTQLATNHTGGGVKAAATPPAPPEFVPQLLNDIEDGTLDSLLDDTQHCLQEKFDGRNLTVTIRNRVPAGYNKKGQPVGLSESVGFAIAPCPIDLVLPGEAMDDQHFAFDLLQLGKENLRKKPYAERLGALMSLNSPSEMASISFEGTSIHIVETAFSPLEKRHMYERLKAAGAEGVVFKRLDAKFSPGRPNSGGPQLRFKFKKTASVIVQKINERRSVAIALMDDDGQMQNIGNVTVPANQEIPRQGDIIEVQYLYRASENGSLYQPVLLGIRDDTLFDECTFTLQKLQVKGQGPANITE